MVQATCRKCKTVHQFDDDDVPPSGKVVKCKSCQAPVTVMPNAAAEMGLKEDGGDFIDLGAAELLPEQPKRKSALADAKAAPATPNKRKSPLADARATSSAKSASTGLGDLPAPKGAGPGRGNLPAPKGPRPSGLGDVPASKPRSGLSDLPAPRAKSSGPPDLPAPRAKSSGPPDLPAPKAKSSGPPDLPAPKGAGPSSHGDLPAPKGAAPSSHGDLPAPKAKSSGPPDLPAPKGASSSGAPDLPAPKPAGLSDLPAPKGAAPSSQGDLPAPKGPGAGRKSGHADAVALSDLDLPAPRGDSSEVDLPTPRGPGNLPTPKRPPDLADLPAPSGPGDLPTPKTGKQLPDLMAPRESTPSSELDLPAPKGAGAGASSSADEASSAGAAALDLDDIGLASSDGKAPPKPLLELDDPIGEPPQAASGPQTGAGGLDLGDSLDLGGPEPSGTPGGAPGLDLDQSIGAAGTSEPGGGAAAGGEPLSPGGLDLGDLEPPGGAEPGPRPGAGGPDLGDSLDLGVPEPSGTPGGAPGLDLDQSFGDAGTSEPGGGEASGGEPLSLDGLDLESPSSSSSSSSRGSGLELDLGGGDEMDLPGGKGDDGVVSFGKSKKKGGETKSATAKRLEKRRQQDAGSLELDLQPDDALARPERARSKVADGAAPAVDHGKGKARGKQTGEETGKDKGPASKKKRLIMMAAALGAVLLAGGGYLFMQWRAEAEIADKAKGRIDAAREKLAAHDWKAAAAAAAEAVNIDPENATAMALAMQARFAEVIDLGAPAGPARQQTSSWADKLNSMSAQGPEISKAQGLRLVVEGKPAEAVKLLADAAAKQPRDGNAFLFLGWGHRARLAHGPAADAFGKALKRTPKRVNALYGLARSQMALGQNEAADKTLSAILELDKNHLGAQISKVELAEIGRFGEREKRYLTLLGREDIGKADHREVARAWALAGAVALAAGRVGEASDRFAKALELDGGNLGAHVGAARADLAEGRIDNALSRIERVLKLAPANVDALLTLAELRVAKEEYMAGLDVVEKVLGRKPPLQDRELLTRAYMIRGDIFASDEQTAGDAEEDYKAAMDNAYEGNIAPVVALSKLYNKIGRGDEAVELLKPVKEAANDDPALAVTLGVAYLGAGDAASAENWFSRALELRPDDVEAKFQLGLAMAAQNKFEEAIATLEAAYQAEEDREDIGIRLAGMYENMGMREKAYKQYDELLTKETKGPDGKPVGPSINLRSQAGRFFARLGDTERAAKLGDSILADQPKNPAGLYLKGEALMAEEQYREARDLFSDAARNDPQPQFYEGLGRAYEGLGELNPAAKAYARALEGDLEYLAPRLARARIFVAQRRFSKALEEIDKAGRIDPKNPKIEFYRGKTYVALKKFDKAITYLSKAVRLDPRPAEPYYQLGIAYYNSDKPSQAASSLQRATKKASGDETWLVEGFRVLGYAHRAAGNRAGAIAAFRNYLDRAKKGTREVDEVKRLLLRLQAR